jgi:saccharopine dehydrogenase-like NADP-dependent oxidoreductase
MNVAIIGGGGYFGRAAAHFLAKEPAVSGILVAGRNSDAACAFAKRLGPKARGAELDLQDASDLDRVLEGADMIVNATGPYFATLMPVLQAALRSGTDYVDFAEDLSAIEQALALDRQAKAAGITAIVGMGGAPGITNLLALHALRRLDRVDRVQVGWVADVEGLVGAPDENLRDIRARGRVSGAIQSILRYASGQIKAYRSRRWTEIAAYGKAETVALADGSDILAYPVGTAEPIMLLPYLPEVQSVSGLIALLPPQINELLRRHAAPIATGDRSAAEAAIAFFEELARDRARWLERPPGMTRGGKFAVVHGTKDGRHARYSCASNWRCRTGDPEIERPDTGAVAALAALKIMGGDVTQKGVTTPEACFEPIAFFQELVDRWAGPRGPEPLLKERFDWLAE